MSKIEKNHNIQQKIYRKTIGKINTIHIKIICRRHKKIICRRHKKKLHTNIQKTQLKYKQKLQRHSNQKSKINDKYIKILLENFEVTGEIKNINNQKHILQELTEFQN